MDSLQVIMQFEEQLSFTSYCKTITSNKLLVRNTQAESQFQLNESPIDSNFMAYSSNIDFMSIGDMLTLRDDTSTDSDQPSSPYQSHLLLAQRVDNSSA
ncbi:hypothetical protein TIFTF001_039585 [Ficus carica]|uniref:Uncharacterized protein n=1 Tax=Ficus carica TaxID=3494 RepID=A0AA88JE78_FICCA|nr:hypothetical protein TIFTF001_039561 [Ficus carica]GMN70527.1 hypothetical protein TIFTF001_039573 [Ficus carica]GMN70535.1 hypothetical protein TIFTF001_039581 [Ficus carica]GMN70546.1 hypothetical protein TIFTF001_039585 [Ficus carica]